MKYWRSPWQRGLGMAESEHEFFGVQTSSGKSFIGPQRAVPASVAQIEAQVTRARADLVDSPTWYQVWILPKNGMSSEWRFFAEFDNPISAGLCVEEQKWIDSRPPRGNYRYAIRPTKQRHEPDKEG